MSCIQTQWIIFKFEMNCESTNTVMSINETSIENISSSIIENMATTSLTTKMAQTIGINAGEINCRNFEVGQDMKASIGFTQQLDTNTTTEIRNAINNEIDRSIEQDYESRRGWGADLDPQHSNNVEIRNILHNIVNESMTHRNIQHIIGNQSTSQAIDISVGQLTGDNCIFNQATVINLTVEQMLNTVMNRMMSSDTSNRVLEILAQRLKRESAGPLESLGNKKGAKKQPLMYGAVLLAVIALIGGVIALVIRSASNRPTDSTDVTDGPDTIVDDSIDVSITDPS